jgi:hypothetical protein
MFDELVIQVEAKTVYVFQLLVLNAAALEKSKWEAQSSVAGTFWSFCAGKLFTMNVLTDDVKGCSSGSVTMRPRRPSRNGRR